MLNALQTREIFFKDTEVLNSNQVILSGKLQVKNVSYCTVIVL